MFKKLLKRMLLLSILMVTILVNPAQTEINSEAAMDSTVQKSVKLPIIMYHSILKDPRKSDVYVATPEALYNDLKYLKDNGFETVVIQDLINYVKGQADLPEKPVMITFDDGHYNNMYYALPILQELNYRAVLSIVGKYADYYSKNPDPNPNYAYLSWDEIRQLSESGYFEIQNHSYDMHSIGERKGSKRKNGESEAAYFSVFSEDLMKQQMMLQNNSRVTATAFTYPFGFVCPEAQFYLTQLEFSASLICVERINYIQAGNPDCLFDLGRFNRSGKTTTKAFMKKIMKELR